MSRRVASILLVVVWWSVNLAVLAGSAAPGGPAGPGECPVSPVPPGETATGGSQPLEPVQPHPGELPPGPIETLAPGMDTSLCMRWEPTIAVDPNNQQVVAVAQGATVQISFNGGASFTDQVVGATPMTCDDGTTPCFSNANCNGIGSGTCFVGQCPDNATYCNTNAACTGIGTGNCGGLFGGDPSLAFDSQGRLFLTYLCTLPNAGRDVCITGYQPSGGAVFNPIPGINWPVRATVAAGFAGQNADKEWLAADSFPGSPFQDRLHLVWTDLAGANDWEIWTTFSTDQGQTWSPAVNVSPLDGSEGRVWPAHNTVAPNGDVYVAYHSQTGFLPGTSRRTPDGVSGQVFVARSSTGGALYATCDDGTTACTRDADCGGIGTGTCNGKEPAFGPGQADTTWNVQHFRFCDDGTTICTSNANCMGIGSGTCNAPLGVIPGAQYWTQGTSQPWVMAAPDVPGRIYVVANDDPDNNVNAGDQADVFIVRSDDFGVTWTNPIRVDGGPAGTAQLLPAAAVDPITGAIGVIYYDDRGMVPTGGGNLQLDLLATYSYDGGTTWTPEVDFNDGLFNPDTASTCRFCGPAGPTNAQCTSMACASAGAGTTRIGEYNGIAFGECTAHVAWADNAVPACGGDTDTIYDADPEGGGDLDPPAIDCPDDVMVDCTASTDPSNTGEATAVDNCVAAPSVGSVDDVTPGACPQEMTIERIWSASDAAGNSDSCSQTIEVVDDTPPAVGAPDPLELECNAAGGVPASDPQVVAWLAMATAVDDCGMAALTDDAPALFPASCPPGVPSEVTFTGEDECGNSDTAISSVTVVDRTMPEVDCAVAVEELWPPSHGFVDVGFSYTATDVCDPELEVEITVTSDEHPQTQQGAGGPIHCPDALVEQDGTVRLRAERAGGGDGRVYVITVTATDECGNQNACQAAVTVAKSMNPHVAAQDTGQAFDATQCEPDSEGLAMQTPAPALSGVQPSAGAREQRNQASEASQPRSRRPDRDGGSRKDRR